MNTEKKEQIVAECRELMTRAKYDETKTDQFCQTVSDILQEVINHAAEQRAVQYKLIKHIDRVEFRIDISGDEIDPMEEGEGAEDRRIQNAVNHVLFNPETSVSGRYKSGWNRITVKSPSRIANSKLLNDPMIKAMLLGIVAGVICRLIPEKISGIIIGQIATPVMSTLIGLLMGLMGPVFFLFIIVAISSLGSMEELTRTGKVILKRFILTGLWVALFTTAVALLFFPVFGKAKESADLSAVREALLDIVPKGFFSPFTEGNIPQVILLGILFGVGLLVMGDRGAPVRDALGKVKEWAMGVMSLIMKILPLLPFISTMMIIANGKWAVFVQGWKYIAAAYICYLATLLLEFIAVSVRCKRRIRDMGRMLRGIAGTAFLTATPPLTIQSCYEVSDREMDIDPSFTDLWLSLAYNLLSPARTIALVLSVFFVADMSGMTVDIALIIIMLIMVIQLTLASTGTVPSATIILKSLNMSTDSVGLFSAFDIFTRNAGAAYDVTYIMLEQMDAARQSGKTGSSDTEESGESE